MKIILPIAAALLLTTAAGAQTPGKEGVAAARTTNGVANWTTYNADLKGSRYSPLDQINPGNFKDLEIAWRFKTDILGSRPEYKLESTPLAVDGVIYTTGGTRRAVVALPQRLPVVGRWRHRSLRRPRLKRPRSMCRRRLPTVKWHRPRALRRRVARPAPRAHRVAGVDP